MSHLRVIFKYPTRFCLTSPDTDWDLEKPRFFGKIKRSISVREHLKVLQFEFSDES